MLIARGFSGHFMRGVMLLASVLASHASQAAASPEAEEKVSRLIDNSGIAHTLRQVQPVILLGMQAPQNGIPENVRSALREAATQAFQPDPMIERVRARLSTLLGSRQLDDTLEWLDSPLGRRITAMENASADPESMEGRRRYVREMEQNPPAKIRIDLIDELKQATGSSEFNASMMEAMVLATALGMNAAQPVQQQAPAETLREKVKSSLPHLRQQTDQMVTLSFFYTYRSLSDRELESYAKFMKSPSGDAYSKAAIKSVGEAMVEAIGRFMQTVPKALAKYKGISRA